MGHAILVGKDFLVVKIIDEYSVVINGGSNYDIAPGDVFEIYSRGQDIYDPITKEFLGTLDFVKAKIIARDVFPRMSVCCSQNINPALTAISFSFMEKPEELNVAANDISGGYEDVDREIHVGDLVRKIQLNAKG